MALIGSGATEVNGFSIGLSSLRLRTFKNKGSVCAGCGIAAQYFAIDNFVHHPHTRPHLNMWGIDANGEHSLFTHDHIMPRSKGGKNTLENTQTMCEKCNHLKKDSIPS